MTTEPYASAVGLVERYAAALVSGVPDRPEDDGFFGPASVTWRLAADLSAPVAGLRSVLIQALHPLAMAGVDQHSDWRLDPVGRLAATSGYETTVTYGDRASAARVADANPSHSVRPGSFTCTCESTRPGSSGRSPRSTVRSASIGAS